MSAHQAQGSSNTGRRRRSCFRPCIDLHNGVVKQIVGGTLRHQVEEEEERKEHKEQEDLQTNFVATQPSAHFAELYRTNKLHGGHVIKLGPNNDQAAREALKAWPKGLQLGGSVNESNAQAWLDEGAEKVIVTSYLFPSGKFALDRLQSLAKLVGKEHLVVDISCRRKDDRWVVAMNKWQDLTDMEVDQASIDLISEYCSELLIHAADVEGLCQGIDEDLVRALGQWVKIPCTYAGGAKDITDLELVDRLSDGKVDLTFGSSLDIFGGKTVKFDELVALSHKMTAQSTDA